MKVEDLKFDSVLDVVKFLDNERIQKFLAINLISVSAHVNEKSNGQMSGVLLEKSKGKFYNFDIG